MDMIPYGEKGRPMGQYSGKSKFSDAAVELMRRYAEEGRRTNRQICEEFGIHKSTLSLILNYKSRAVTPTKWKPRKKTDDQ